MPPEGGRRSGATRKAPEKASERLRRLLTVVPYLVRNQGTRVAEAADLFGMSEPELLADLDLLFVSGLPPYGPGDLIDVDIQDGRIWIGMADYFARPLRLTRSEALAIYLRGTVLAGAPGLEEAPALSSALAKLADALGPETLGDLPERVDSAGDGRTPDTLAELRRAATERERLRIEYYAAWIRSARNKRSEFERWSHAATYQFPIAKKTSSGSISRSVVSAPEAA